VEDEQYITARWGKERGQLSYISQIREERKEQTQRWISSLGVGGTGYSSGKKKKRHILG